ncbi:non-histone chromosomal protein 6 [Podospora australis]|uniref:Non-histone chromosomal protein 6 n=1 Tax=Podospora australis TaxID=1536484 RepID=A0AAN6X2R3_9PEZI|nr:non-histone chromosomal protein 6 [Podospora australis]
MPYPSSNARKPQKVKPPVSAWIFYCEDLKKRMSEGTTDSSGWLADLDPNYTSRQVTLVLGERWKAASNEDRAPYEAMAAADKQRYEKEMREQRGADYGPSEEERRAMFGR